MSVPGTAGAAPPLRRLVAQAGFEARAVLRNGEQLLVTLALPLLALIGLTTVRAIDVGSGRRVDLVVPGVLGLAVLAASFTSQAIATGFDRRNGVLRLAGTTPLGRSGLLAGKVVAVLGVELAQAVLLVASAMALGWRPAPGGLLLATLVGLLGSAAFVALALLVAGTVRVEAVLALANLALVLLAVGGGILVPAASLPAPLGAVVGWLPSGALGEGLRGALGDGGVPGRVWLVLVVWAGALAAAVRRWFRWD